MNIKKFAEFVSMVQDEKWDDTFPAVCVSLWGKYKFPATLDGKMEDGFDWNFKNEWKDFLRILCVEDDHCDITFKTNVTFQLIKDYYDVRVQSEKHGFLNDEEIPIPWGAHDILIQLHQTDKIIVSCLNCGRIFVKTQKRDKKFCSSVCRSHYSMKKQRGKV